MVDFPVPTAPFAGATVVGDEDWGKLVMSWSTRLNFVTGDATPFGGPPGQPFAINDAVRVSRTDFDRAVTDGRASLTLPNGIEEVVFVQDTPTRRYIRLPEGDMVLAARAELGAGYALPTFYIDPPLNCADPRTFTLATS